MGDGITKEGEDTDEKLEGIELFVLLEVDDDAVDGGGDPGHEDQGDAEASPDGILLEDGVVEGTVAAPVDLEGASLCDLILDGFAGVVAEHVKGVDDVGRHADHAREGVHNQHLQHRQALHKEVVHFDAGWPQVIISFSWSRFKVLE